MKGCPHCSSLKELFDNNSVSYLERDIDNHKDEYEKLIVNETNNEFLPAILLMDIEEPVNPRSNITFTTLTPDDDFTSLEEALEITKEMIKR